MTGDNRPQTGPVSRRSARGDAEAVLRAVEGGGWAALLGGGTTVSAVADDPFAARVQIRPFDIFDNRHYCVLDWHTIALAWIEGGDRSFRRQDADAIISQAGVELELDGEPLLLTQTPVARFLNPEFFGLQTAYYSQWGTIISPDELTVGEHTLRGRITDATGAIVFDNTITFIIDAAGSGVCV